MKKKVINSYFYEGFQDFKKAIREFFEIIEDYKDELELSLRLIFKKINKVR